MTTRHGSEPAPFAAPPPRNPFGAASPRGDLPALTLPDAARRCRWIAVDIGADVYGVFHLSAAVEKPVLTRCFDSDYPRSVGTTLSLDSRNVEFLGRHVRQSTLPCWWDDGRGSVTADTLCSLGEVVKLPEPEVAGSGIAFPVFADRGQCGVILFGGANIQLTEGHAWTFHARAFDLFAALSHLNPHGADQAAAISKREIECLKLTANGLTSGEIASALRLSVHTTNQYLTSAGQKLGADNRVHAVAKALRSGLIE